jgi:hypothetical protein
MAKRVYSGKGSRPLELKIGKRYRSRNDRETTRLTPVDDDLFHTFGGYFIDDPKTPCRWRSDGIADSSTTWDNLVEEID